MSIGLIREYFQICVSDIVPRANCDRGSFAVSIAIAAFLYGPSLKVHATGDGDQLTIVV